MNSIASGSAADKAGVEPGDLLTSMEGVSLGSDGTLADYCSVLQTHGQESTLAVEAYRPSSDSYLRGQFNGDPLKPTTTVSSGISGTSNPSTTQATSVGGFTTVTDNSGTVSVDVPTAWSQLDGTEFVDDKNNRFYGLEVSSDIAQYKNGWGAVGASVLASEEAVTNSSPEELLNWAAQGLPEAGCTSRGRMDYQDALHTGLFEAWENCGPDKAKYIVVAAKADSGRYLALVAVQANSEADVAAADRVVNSFSVGL
ncbi:PDZ domain-containing protein [Rhodococcus qingshengii]|uniref:PDZ domain-containing protein n=1 Tax=Rhodococcus qingshengii TaxID=334542 RepID=A0AAW6LQV2_RHOSG|nr:PDZ domain-containing protein [Rhodococcus qingshengii]MDE8649518.1 PDZ domain-containing protein [Rhodococcus qingshengii]